MFIIAALIAVPVVAAAPRIAAANPPLQIVIDPPPPIAMDPLVDWRHDPALLEWSTWFRLGFGVASAPSDVVARSIVPPPSHDQQTTWETGLGADVTLPLTHRLRIGPYVELRGLEPTAGVEVQLARAPADVDMFWYRGEGIWSVRAGTGERRATAALAWGYRCPWKLWGPYSKVSRYEIGARIVAAASRAHDDRNDWSMTLGLEVEPVGAIRYLLGIKSWY